MEASHPLAQAAVISIDVLHMHGPFDTCTGGQIDRFMADAGLLGKVAITGVGITDEKDVPVENGRQAFP